VDNVESIQASDPNGGELPLTVFGFTVTGGQQRFTLAANKKLTFFPANDGFLNARALPALIGADPTATECPSGEVPCPATLYAHNTWDSVNFDATLEAGEPTSPATPGSHSVWFTWVATANGQAIFDTAGADFDTIVDVYTGTNFAALTQVAFSDDVFGKQSEATFNAVAGTTYRIRVRGKTPAGGAQDASQGVFPLHYYLIVCGNGVVESGESCDDGNTTSGDCCSSTCALAAGGSACSVGGDLCNVGTCSGTTCTGIAPKNCNDNNVCTNDGCNPASGACTYAFNAVPCDDGSSCTGGDFCSFGTCVSGPPMGVPAGTPTIGMTNHTSVSWLALGGATGYDVVRGSLNTLRSSGGNFATATTTCLGDNQTALGFNDASPLTAGNGFFYLVRGTSCSGSGTYNTTSPKQVASRDAGVEAAPITCSTFCARGKCSIGAPLDPQCDACTVALCGVDPHCCNDTWDALCVQEVRTACGSLTCQESAGTCAHPVCSLGGTLAPGCDNPPMNPSCVTTICNFDPYCCNTEWDGQCVGEVGMCGWNCN
jgi:cysteine-rich repeat protein